MTQTVVPQARRRCWRLWCAVVQWVECWFLSRVKISLCCRVESLISLFAVCCFSLLLVNEYVSCFLVIFLIYLKHTNNIHINLISSYDNNQFGVDTLVSYSNLFSFLLHFLFCCLLIY